MERTQGMGIVARLLLLVAGLLALSIPVAAGVDPRYMEIPVVQALNTTAINSALPNGSLPFILTPTMAPITLLHLELNETSPAGVRYMAFGPKVIEIAVSPVLLIILVGMAGAAAGAWYCLGRRRNGN